MCLFSSKKVKEKKGKIKRDREKEKHSDRVLFQFESVKKYNFLGSAVTVLFVYSVSPLIFFFWFGSDPLHALVI